MTPCTESGCRNLEWKCKDCGRAANTAKVNGFGEWISVKERYPPHDVSVLVIDYEKSIDVSQLWYVEEKPFKWLRCGPGLILESITHWMALPEVPHE
jgi:hypothetical protein